MSKAVKRKVSVELQKPSSKSRLSVFQRLGTKKSKSLSQESKSLSDDFKQTLSAAVSITTKPILSKPDAIELEDADPDSLEKKREEIRKELELQMKMDSRRIASRKRKHAESSSSSSSSGSDSDSSSSTSSSSSSDNRHKSRKLKSSKRRDSSSSSDEYAKKLAKKKRACQSKKEALKLHKLSKKHEIVVSRKSKKRSPSPLTKKHRSAGDSSSIMLSPSGQKVMVKNLKISASLDKHHRVREKDVDRSELLQRSERERLRMREECIRSRSPKRSRTPKRTSPSLLRRSPSDKRNHSLSRRMDGEHERREKERELAREKERREALLRSQERRERLAKDSKSQRLLPRPAERAMALAAAQERNTEKDVGYSNRSFASERPNDAFEHRRHEKDAREHDRYEKYESHGRREQSEQYQHGSNYRRDWHDESTSSKDLYERSTDHQSSSRDWDHKRSENLRPGDYSERKDWNDSAPKWADRGKPTEKYERRSGQNEYVPQSSSRNYPDRSESFDPGSTSTVSKSISASSGGIRGRWSTWRGRGGRGTHQISDFRRPHHHTEILETRGEIYRRHINPQAANLNKSATAAKPSDMSTTVSTSIEKQNDDTNKPSSLMTDDNPDGEEIADDLSEISDEADDILGQQEDTNTKSQQAVENVAGEKPVADVELKESTVPAVKDSVDAETDKSIDPNDGVQMREIITQSKSPEEPDRSKDLCDDIDLDFEEISDGELEEEARKGLGDALGVDWGSLVEESKAMMREKLTKCETSAKQRWNPDQILLDVGVSYKMAGTAFAQQILLNAYENVKRESKCSKIKTEPIDDANHTDVQVKIEHENDKEEAKVNGKCAIEDTTIVKEDHKLILHPLPCVQTSIQHPAEKQRQLVFNVSGPYSRGLCIKRDIGLRRKLCNLSVSESNCKTVTTKTGYENIAMKLFQKVL